MNVGPLFASTGTILKHVVPVLPVLGDETRRSVQEHLSILSKYQAACNATDQLID